MRLLDKDPSLARAHYEYRTPIAFAVRENQVEVAAYLLDHGADLDARDEEWCATPLAWAAKFGHIRLVEYLLRRCARTRLADDPPCATPMALAAHRGHTQIVELLTEYERSGTLPQDHTAYYEGLVRDILVARAHGFETWTRSVEETERTS